MPLRLLLADNHQMVRQGVRMLLERESFEIIAEAANGQDAVRLTANLRPDVAVLAASMPELNGIDAAHQMNIESPA